MYFAENRNYSSVLVEIKGKQSLEGSLLYRTHCLEISLFSSEPYIGILSSINSSQCCEEWKGEGMKAE